MKEQETFEAALSRILVKQEAISAEESKAIQKVFYDSKKEQFNEFLLDKGLVEEDDLLEALAIYYEVPAVDVVGLFFDTFLLRKFPKGFLLRNGIIPLEVDENIMVIVASEPNDSELLDKIGKHVSYNIRFYVGFLRDICDTVKEFYDKAYTEESQDKDLRKERRLSKEMTEMEDDEDEMEIEFIPLEDTKEED